MTAPDGATAKRPCAPSLRSETIVGPEVEAQAMEPTGAPTGEFSGTVSVCEAMVGAAGTGMRKTVMLAVAELVEVPPALFVCVAMTWTSREKLALMRVKKADAFATMSWPEQALM